MVKNKTKEAELFSPGEMKGGVKKRDYSLDESVSAYLMYLKRLSIQDDDTCLQLQRECEDVAGKPVNGTYFIKTLGNTINTIQFMALRDCVNMRVFTLQDASFMHHEAEKRHPHVTFPVAFVKARETFRECFSKEYAGKTAWIIDKSCEEINY